jgi:pimeloyl-ACP methyl ester carboxylesterase
MKSRRFVMVGGVLLAGFAAVNLVAYRHARSMLVFAESGSKTPAAYKLSRGEKLLVLSKGVSFPHIVDKSTPEARGLPYSLARIPTRDSFLEVWTIPAKQSRGSILMFHGYGASKDSLLNAAAPLHELGYDLVLVDFPGYGGSPGSMTTIGYREAESVKTVFDWKRRRTTGHIVLYGVSMGAASVLRAVGVFGVSPDAVILESPFDRLSTTIGHRFTEMGLPAFPFTQLLLFWGGRLAGMDAFAHDPAVYARSVQCPTLLMSGTLDRYVYPDEARSVFSSLAGAKTLKMFEGLGHQDLSVGDPKEWKIEVAQFLGVVGRKT